MEKVIFDYPEVQDVDIAFGIGITPKILNQAKEAGFYDKRTPYNDLFSKLFFSGGKLNFKKGLNPDSQTRATRYLKAVMGSFEPKHEEKEAVCAMILSELVEI